MTLPIPHLDRSTIQRFWSKVSKDDNCWEWQGYIRDRYGAIKIKGHNYSVHRIAYSIHYGIDPGIMLVCHTCDNPLCIRKDHLFLGTVADNVADRVLKNRSAHPIGASNPRAILTLVEVIDIRQSTQTEVELGYQFGISSSLAGQIRRRQKWKHVS